MKLIPLTQGKFAMVDDDMFEELSKHKWHAHEDARDHFVAARTSPGPKRRAIYMHRVVIGALPGQQVDHRYGNSLNNQRYNLRIADDAEQRRGFQRKRLNCSSRFRGVHWNKRARKWHAKIRHDGRYYYIGLFIDEKAAAEAFDAKAREFGWPEYGLNFPRIAA